MLLWQLFEYLVTVHVYIHVYMDTGSPRAVSDALDYNQVR